MKMSLGPRPHVPKRRDWQALNYVNDRGRLPYPSPLPSAAEMVNWLGVPPPLIELIAKLQAGPGFEHPADVTSDRHGEW